MTHLCKARGAVCCLRRTWSVAALCFVASFGIQACSLPAHIDDALFQNLSLDRKLLLFDAENDVSVASDAQVQMQAHLVALRDERRMAHEEAAWALADDGAASRDDAIGSSASTQGDSASGPGQTALTWRLREAYLAEASAYLRQRIGVQTSVIDAARARFELTKAQAAQQEKLLSQSQIGLPKFVAQVQRYNQAQARALKTLAPKQEACAKARSVWLAQREALVAHNIDKMGMVGAEEVPVWELW